MALAVPKISYLHHRLLGNSILHCTLFQPLDCVRMVNEYSGDYQ